MEARRGAAVAECDGLPDKCTKTGRERRAAADEGDLHGWRSGNTVGYEYGLRQRCHTFDIKHQILIRQIGAPYASITTNETEYLTSSRAFTMHHGC